MNRRYHLLLKLLSYHHRLSFWGYTLILLNTNINFATVQQTPPCIPSYPLTTSWCCSSPHRTTSFEFQLLILLSGWCTARGYVCVICIWINFLKTFFRNLSLYFSYPLDLILYSCYSCLKYNWALTCVYFRYYTNIYLSWQSPRWIRIIQCWNWFIILPC